MKGSDGLPQETCLTTTQYLIENMGHTFDYILSNAVSPIVSGSWVDPHRNDRNNGHPTVKRRQSVDGDTIDFENGGGRRDESRPGNASAIDQPICLCSSSFPFSVVDRPFQQVSDHHAVRACFQLPTIKNDQLLKGVVV